MIARETSRQFLIEDTGSAASETAAIAQASLTLIRNKAAECLAAGDALEDALQELADHPAGLVSRALSFAESAETLRTALCNAGLLEAAELLQLEQRRLEIKHSDRELGLESLSRGIESFRMAVQSLLDDLPR